MWKTINRREIVKTICLVMGLVFSHGSNLIAAETKDTKWYDAQWEYRIGIEITNKLITPIRNEPVVITGEYFGKKTGTKTDDINTTSIRVTDNNAKLVASQVDERDNTGFYVKTPNLKLDKNDEIVFEVNVPKGGTTKYWIYFSPKGKPAVGDGTSNVNIADNNTGYGQMKVTTPYIKAIIKGPSIGDAATPSLESHSVGNITSLEVETVPMVNMGYSWAWALPGEWMAGYPCSADVTLPVVLIEGAIRKIVMISRDLPEKLAAETEITSKYLGYIGNVIRYFKFYGNVPLMEMEDVYNKGKWDMMRIQRIRDRGGMGGIGIYFNLFSVGTLFPRPTAILYAPSGSDVYEKKFDEFKTKENTVSFYKKPNGGTESWLAWVDTEENKGLALFYEDQGKGESVGFFTGTGEIKEVRPGAPWNSVSYTLPDNLSQEKQQVRFKLAYRGLLNNDYKKQAQAYYRCWREHMTDMITFGFVEENKP